MRRFLFEHIFFELLPIMSIQNRIVVTRPLVGDWRSILEAAGQVTVIGGPEGPERGQLIAAVGDADALVCLLTDDIDATVVASADRLRVIGNCAVGVDNIDVTAAQGRGITICHTPNVLTDATADFAFALLLAASRRVVEADRFVRAGRWVGWRPDLLLGRELRGAQLGVLGFGRIGREVSRRAAGFGMRVTFWDRRRERVDGIDAEYQELDVLLSTSDAVSVHLPLNRGTRHLLDEARLSLMKADAVLVNTGRGPVIDEAALATVMTGGHLFAAGLDVFETEPDVAKALLELENVVVAPHIGSATAATRARMAELVCADTVRVLSGKEPMTSVK